MNVYKAEVEVDVSYNRPGSSGFDVERFRDHKLLHIAAATLKTAIEDIDCLGERFPNKYGNPEISSICELGPLNNSGLVIDAFMELGGKLSQENPKATS